MFNLISIEKTNFIFFSLKRLSYKYLSKNNLIKQIKSIYENTKFIKEVTNFDSNKHWIIKQKIKIHEEKKMYTWILNCITFQI